MYSIIFEDNDLLVVNKEPGILTLPDRFKPDEFPSVYRDLSKKYGKIFIVHRLDKETSGTICFAKNEAAHRHLSMQFEHRKSQKFYWALVQGILQEKEGLIDAPIAEHPANDGSMCIHRSGKPSSTSYKVLEEFKGFSWVEAQIHTGRTHQVRVHFKHIGHPLAVDPLYNHERKALYLSEIKQRGFRLGKWVEEEQPLLSRVPLHAARLILAHPSTESEIALESPLPKDLKAVLNQLRKWGK